MRVGFKVTYDGRPVEGASIVPLLPLTSGFPFFPAQPVTDRQGEWFGISPLAISPARYLLDVTVHGMGHQVRINGPFEEIENRFLVDLSRGTFTTEQLGSRIPGDGYFALDQELLREEELIDVSDDPVKFISSCATCQYFFPPGFGRAFCVVNGLRTAAIPIPSALNITCRLYYPFFLQPNSPQRLQRDISRRIPLPSEDLRELRITPALAVNLPGRGA